MGKLNGAVLQVTPFQQNCAVLWDETGKQGVVVDPGGDVDRILALIDQTGAAIEQIWLTHGHLDHAGGATELQEVAVPSRRGNHGGANHRAGPAGRIFAAGAGGAGPQLWLCDAQCHAGPLAARGRPGGIR